MVEKKNMFQIKSVNPLNMSYIIKTGCLSKHMASHFSSISNNTDKWTTKTLAINYILYHSIGNLFDVTASIDTNYVLLNDRDRNMTFDEAFEDIRKNSKCTCSLFGSKVESTLIIKGKKFKVTSMVGRKKVFFEMKYINKTILKFTSIDDISFIRESKIDYLIN